MDCQQIRNLLPLFEKKELEQCEIERIEKHLQRCPDCREEAGCYKKLAFQTAQLARYQKDAESISFLKAVQAEMKPLRQRNTIRKYTIVWLTACLFMAAGLTLQVYRQGICRPLKHYLIEEDYAGLYEAFQNPLTRHLLMDDPVSASLLMRSVSHCHSRALRAGLYLLMAQMAEESGKNIEIVHVKKMLKSLDHQGRSKITLNQMIDSI